MSHRAILVALALVGCATSPADDFAAVRPHVPAFCSAECVAAHDAATGCDTAILSPDLESCLDACDRDPELTCDGGASGLLDYDCLVACASMEPQQIQDALVAELDCEYPSVCR